MTLEHFKRLELLKTFHNHICKEQSKDSFCSDFVLRSIIKMFEPFGAWQGGGVAYQKVGYKTPFLYVR